MVPRNGISLLFESSAFESASSFNCAAKGRARLGTVNDVGRCQSLAYVSEGMSSKAQRALSRVYGRVFQTNTYHSVPLYKPGCTSVVYPKCAYISGQSDSILVSVKACQGNAAVWQGVRVLSPDIFAALCRIVWSRPPLMRARCHDTPPML